MNRSTFAIALLSTTLCSMATAQELRSPVRGSLATKQAASPVAFVYVAGSAKGSVNHIEAFSAAADGRLTPVAGSPFQGDVVSIAGNGKYLFGSTQGTDIETFFEEPDGALQKVTGTDTQRNAGCPGGGPGTLVLDHTGSTLYDFYYNGQSCADNTFQSFEVQKSNGDINFLGSNYESPWNMGPLSFIGSDHFAYSAVCDVFTSPPGPQQKIYGFERQGNGMLTYVNVSAPLPAPVDGKSYCPNAVAADPTNHVAIAVQPFAEETLYTPQLATYTADKYGNLTTSSTTANMPQTEVITINTMKMAPSGKLLAVGGTEGLQIFHFNGGEPITHDTGLLAKVDIEGLYWDNNDHLYAISTFTNKLYVFTVTPTSVSQAPGSPYTISSPQSVDVQPR